MWKFTEKSILPRKFKKFFCHNKRTMKRSVQFEGIGISYVVAGEGKAIVLLHGYLEAGEVWKPLTESLEQEFMVIAIDLPGHGRSGVRADIHTMEFLAGAVRAVLDDVGVKKAVMVGHSLGGYATLAFVEIYPDMLAGYVLFHSHPHADTPAAVARREREIAVVRAGRKNIMYPGNVRMMFAEKNLKIMTGEHERVKMIASGNPGDGIIALLNGMIARPSRKAVLEGGEVPLLWILGKWDLYFTPEKALHDTRLPQNAEVIILEGSGHLGFLEETDKSAALIAGFVHSMVW